MKKTILGLIGLVAIAGFTGCAGGNLTITKCKSYKDGICVAKEVKQVKECKNPIKVGNKTYCE